MFHDICESSVIHVVLTCISSLVRQYTRTTNRSLFRMISSGSQICLQFMAMIG